MANSVFSSMVEKFKSAFIPEVDDKLAYTFNGELAVYHKKSDSYTAYVNGELVEIPSNMVIKMPVFTINKPIDQLRAGDTIKTKSLDSSTYTYSVITEVRDGVIYSNTFCGNKKRSMAIKDFFMGQKTVTTVLSMNMFGGQQDNGTANPFGNMNPMMLALLSDGDTDLKKMLPFMMMGNAGNGMNPMMLALLSGDDFGSGDDKWLIMAMMANQGNNAFANIFNFANSYSAVPTTDAAQN